MSRTETFLFLSIALFVVWLFVTIVHPMLGFLISLAGFVVLVSFLFFMLMCYFVTKRR